MVPNRVFNSQKVTKSDKTCQRRIKDDKWWQWMAKGVKKDKNCEKQGQKNDNFFFKKSLKVQKCFKRCNKISSKKGQKVSKNEKI